MPIYSFEISGHAGTLSPENPLFGHLLPQNRLAQPSEKPVSCGAFLEAASRFLDSHMDVLVSLYGETIEGIRIVLEKHGAFYHPCRLLVNGRMKEALALNGAVTELGCHTMGGEVRALGFLREKGLREIPEVYCSGSVHLPCGQEASFFVAPWFGDFWEFHWSFTEGGPEVLLWKDGGERVALQRKERHDLFRKMARILTLAYDFDTFAQIFPWHHGAGDFVAFLHGGRVDARLITVRRYENLYALDPETSDLKDKLEGLLYFFWNMLLRMRLDRLDGVGDLFFAPEDVLAPTISGFMEGLGEKVAGREDIAMIVNMFPEIMASLGREGIFVANGEIADAWNARAPELPLIQEHMRAHSDRIFEFFEVPKGSF